MSMHATTRMAWLSIATSLGTIVLKFGAYFLTGSVSLWSDALEALVNLAAGIVALGAVTLAARPADENHAFGHDKAEYFSSGVEGTLILVAAISIIWSALQRFMAPQTLEHLGPGILVAVLAGAANYTTARIMLRVGKQHDSITIEADAHHLMTDVWTSVGVISGLLVVMVKPQWSILDPVMAIAVAAADAERDVAERLDRAAGHLVDHADAVEADEPLGRSFH
jgi:cation diffusion facilitator family transporter